MTYKRMSICLVLSLLPLSKAGIAAGSTDLPGTPLYQVTSTTSFDFYDDPWINLHHFLFEWARSQTAPPAGDRRPAVAVSEKSSTLPAGESPIWEGALAYYRDRLIAKNLTFDADLKELKAFLLLPHKVPIEVSQAPDAMRPWLRVLNDAMPVYEAHWWAEHRKANEKFLAQLAPLVESYESFLVPQLPKAYGGNWPSSRIRVDASVYAGTYGGYTTNQPDNIVLGSMDPVKEGLGGLDTLFHEASHAESFEASLQAQLAQSFGIVGVEVPRDLVHVIQFFTPSFLLQTKLGEKAKDYTPLAVRLGLYGRLPHWSTYRDLLERFWVPFLRGEVDRPSALKNLAAGLAHLESEPS